jgi:hypothetical protein
VGVGVGGRGQLGQWAVRCERRGTRQTDCDRAGSSAGPAATRAPCPAARGCGCGCGRLLPRRRAPTATCARSSRAMRATMAADRLSPHPTSRSDRRRPASRPRASWLMGTTTSRARRSPARSRRWKGWGGKTGEQAGPPGSWAPPPAARAGRLRAAGGWWGGKTGEQAQRRRLQGELSAAENTELRPPHLHPRPHPAAPHRAALARPPGVLRWRGPPGAELALSWRCAHPPRRLPPPRADRVQACLHSLPPAPEGAAGTTPGAVPRRPPPCSSGGWRQRVDWDRKGWQRRAFGAGQAAASGLQDRVGWQAVQQAGG